MTARFKVLFFALVLLPLAAACGATLTAEDRESIAKDGIYIAVCQAEALDCKKSTPDAAAIAATCWPVYDSCMSRHGLTDAGGDE